MVRKRPIGISIISLVLGWLSLAGYIGIFTKSNLSFIILLGYGTTALLSAIGLWKMRTWALRAYFTWCVVVIVMGIYMQISPIYKVPVHLFAIFIFLVVVILGLIAFYIFKKLNRTVEPVI